MSTTDSPFFFLQSPVSIDAGWSC